MTQNAWVSLACADWQVKESDRGPSENGGFSHKGEINATSFHMNTKNFVTWTQVVSLSVAGWLHGVKGVVDWNGPSRLQ